MTNTATIADLTTNEIICWAIPENIAHQLVHIIEQSCGSEVASSLWVLVPYED